MELSKKEHEAARAFAKLGGLKGGKARANALTPEERSEIAREGAAARWSKKKDKKDSIHILKATHEGILEIGSVEIPCAVLDTGQRVLTQSGFMRAIGRAR